MIVIAILLLPLWLSAYMLGAFAAYLWQGLSNGYSEATAWLEKTDKK